MTEKPKTGKPFSQTQRAVKLGVTREHLNRVLNGKRESRSLIRRHRKLFGGAA
jgi:transcriptional regulator with XRE-family HTH domain